jgi:sigma-E factor negative regulatory protein RseB
MRRGAALALVGSATLVALTPVLAAPLTPASPASNATPRRPQAQPDRGHELLTLSVSAGREHSYSGTQFVVFWSEEQSTSALVDVVHRAGRDTVMRVAPTPSLPDGATYHQDDSVTVVDEATLALMGRNYEAEVQGNDRVAGRPTDVVVVRKPGLSPQARFWLDQETHVALRREVYDADGRVLRASAFVDVELAEPATAEIVSGIDRPEPSGDPLQPTDLDELRDDDWLLPATLPGGLELVDARTIGEDQERVVHLSYSDGISTLSLFEQQGDLDTGSLEGWRRETLGGARVYAKPTYPRRIVWSGGGRVFTLVAECQQPTVEEVVASLPHSEPDTGFAARLGRGVKRVGSWFNPFG